MVRLVALVCLALAVATVLVEAGSAGEGRESLDDLLQKIAGGTRENRGNTPDPSPGIHQDKNSRSNHAGTASQVAVDKDEDGPYSIISKNFVVGAPGRSLATSALAQAERLRRELGLAWFGQELPEGKEFAIVRVELSDEIDEGLTLLCGPGRRFRGDHRVWLTTTRERALGSTLAHELVHVVMNWRFPNGLPPWANEGIASLMDDDERIARRREILGHFARNNQWPSVQLVLNLTAIHPGNESAYTVAGSLTEFLLARGDRATFLRFVDDGGRTGWDTALQKHYQIGTAGELQQQWQSWAARSIPRQTTTRENSKLRS